MVLLGGGVICTLVWPVKAIPKPARTGFLAEAPPVHSASPTVLPCAADAMPASAPVFAGPSGLDPAPYSSPALPEPEPAPAVPAALRLAYAWTGNNGTAWDNSGNWSSAGGGYPDDCGDDATVPSGTWDITLVALQIDDLEVSGNVDFDGSAQSPPVLKADSITRIGSGAITLTFTSTCTLKTFGCP